MSRKSDEFNDERREGKQLTSQVLRVLVMDNRSKVTTIVEDHVEGLSTREGGEGLLDTPVVLFFGLSLPGKDGNTGSSDP